MFISLAIRSLVAMTNIPIETCVGCVYLFVIVQPSARTPLHLRFNDMKLTIRDFKGRIVKSSGPITVHSKCFTVVK